MRTGMPLDPLGLSAAGISRPTTWTSVRMGMAMSAMRCNCLRVTTAGDTLQSFADLQHGLGTPIEHTPVDLNRGLLAQECEHQLGSAKQPRDEACRQRPAFVAVSYTHLR